MRRCMMSGVFCTLVSYFCVFVVLGIERGCASVVGCGGKVFGVGSGVAGDLRVFYRDVDLGVVVGEAEVTQNGDFLHPFYDVGHFQLELSSVTSSHFSHPPIDLQVVEGADGGLECLPRTVEFSLAKEIELLVKVKGGVGEKVGVRWGEGGDRTWEGVVGEEEEVVVRGVEKNSAIVDVEGFECDWKGIGEESEGWVECRRGKGGGEEEKRELRWVLRVVVRGGSGKVAVWRKKKMMGNLSGKEREEEGVGKEVVEVMEGGIREVDMIGEGGWVVEAIGECWVEKRWEGVVEEEDGSVGVVEVEFEKTGIELTFALREESQLEGVDGIVVRGNGGGEDDILVPFFVSQCLPPSIFHTTVSSLPPHIATSYNISASNSIWFPYELQGVMAEDEGIVLSLGRIDVKKEFGVGGVVWWGMMDEGSKEGDGGGGESLLDGEVVDGGVVVVSVVRWWSRIHVQAPSNALAKLELKQSLGATKSIEERTNSIHLHFPKSPQSSLVSLTVAFLSPLSSPTTTSSLPLSPPNPSLFHLTSLDATTTNPLPTSQTSSSIPPNLQLVPAVVVKGRVISVRESGDVEAEGVEGCRIGVELEGEEVGRVVSGEKGWFQSRPLPQPSNATYHIKAKRKGWVFRKVEKELWVLEASPLASLQICVKEVGELEGEGKGPNSKTPRTTSSTLQCLKDVLVSGNVDGRDATKWGCEGGDEGGVTSFHHSTSSSTPFVVSHLCPGKWVVRVQDVEVKGKEVEVEVRGSEGIEPSQEAGKAMVELMVKRVGWSVKGKVLEGVGGGVGFAGVKIHLIPSTPNTPHIAPATTRKDGTFTFKGIKPLQFYDLQFTPSSPSSPDSPSSFPYTPTSALPSNISLPIPPADITLPPISLHSITQPTRIVLYTFSPTVYPPLPLSLFLHYRSSLGPLSSNSPTTIPFPSTTTLYLPPGVYHFHLSTPSSPFQHPPTTVTIQPHPHPAPPPTFLSPPPPPPPHREFLLPSITATIITIAIFLALRATNNEKKPNKKQRRG